MPTYRNAFVSNGLWVVRELCYPITNWFWEDLYCRPEDGQGNKVRCAREGSTAIQAEWHLPFGHG